MRTGPTPALLRRAARSATSLRPVLLPGAAAAAAHRPLATAAAAAAPATPGASPASSPTAPPPRKPRATVPPPKRSELRHLSPVRGVFFGDLSSYAANCVPFPVALSSEQRETLSALVDPVTKFFASVPSAAIDKAHAIPDAVLATAAELGLFGLQIDEQFGGLGLSNTGYARVVEEFSDASLAVTLMAHQSIGLKGILMFGTPEQKAKYLPRLASGEHVAAFALTEPTAGSDAASVKLAATPTPDGSGFTLHGSKMWISNGGTAAVFTVFARTPDPTGAPGATKLTAFIVERAFGGISNGPPEEKLGIRGSNTAVVNFDGTFVPRANVLGEVGGGFKVAVSILNNGRFGMGASTAGGIKKMIARAAEYANGRTQFGQPIANYGLVQEKFARMTLDAYAVEAMSYMTTALIDGAKGPGGGPMDASIEAAICKVYGSEAMMSAANDCIQVLGGMGFSASRDEQRIMRDARILAIFEGTNEILRLFIGLTCLQGPGAELAGLAKAPLSALPLLAREVVAEHTGWGAPRVPGLHPALAKEAAALGVAVAQFRQGVRALLSRHGGRITDPAHQLQVARLANGAMELYGWMAVLSRASAALGEGTPHADHEAAVARAFVGRAQERLAALHVGILNGEAHNGDAAAYAVARDVLGAGRYLAAHPLRV